MTYGTPIPDHLSSFDWYAPHLAWLRRAGHTTTHDPGDAVPSRANLRDADLSGANLRGADMCGADLCGVRLRGASLYGTSLRDAALRDANLFGANLLGANLYGVNLRGADPRGADLFGALGVVALGPVGEKRRVIYGVQHAACIMVQAGCSWASLDDTRAAVLARYADGTGRERHREGYLAALVAIAAILDAQQQDQHGWVQAPVVAGGKAPRDRRQGGPP